MYDYDRSANARIVNRVAYDYQRVMASFTKEIADKAWKMIQSVLKLADEAVHALKFNQTVEVHDDLEKQVTPLVALARWMVTRREAEAEPLSRFAKLTDELTDLTKFWNRPVFLNKDKYLDQVESLVKNLHKTRQDIVKAFRQSGVWKTPTYAK